jgi:thiamine pyrophosphate-dependent acetolactate synthase large subunit-like protein
MSHREGEPKVNRRRFLTGAAVAGVAMTVGPPKGMMGDGTAKAQAPKASPPSAAAMRAETQIPAAYSELLDGKPGSDFMVDVIKSLNIKYIASNPTSGCRGLHESLINYGNNKDPELLTVLHEESGTGIAHGYAKVSGKPMGLLFHGTVGVMHASMALYNAWCDRVPMLLLCGNDPDGADRLPGVPTTHSALDPLALVRDFTKWDDQPGSLQHYAESMVRAYKISTTPPMEPVGMVLAAHLQEHAVEKNKKLVIPKLTMAAPPQGELGAVRELAKLLVAAERPVLVVDRVARSPEGMRLLVELAELTGSVVLDQLGRQNFPSRHYLNQSERGRSGIAQADLVVGMELTDFWGTVNSFVDNPHRPQSSRIKPGTKLVSITSLDLYIRANYQDFQRFQPVDIAIAADAEATLPSLIEEVKKAMTADTKNKIEQRKEELRKSAAGAETRVRANAAVAWDASPITTARLSAEIWNVIKNEDWAMVSRDSGVSNWPHRLWNFDKHYQFIGGSGGSGVGYQLPAAVGGALGHRDQGRLCVNIQPDGDALYAPGALWTAAYHKIPLLTVMHNNRGYHQEVMHVQRVSNWRNRGVDRAHIGTEINNPAPNFAQLAKSLGVESFGPISDPNELAPALKKAVQVAKAGAPVLVDVISQPR